MRPWALQRDTPIWPGLQDTLVLAVLLFFCSTKAAIGEIFTVTNTNDQGTGSLRWAIEQANTDVGLDSVSFAILGTAPFTVQPLSPLPLIYDPVVLDGTTQPGFVGTPVIEIDGTYAGTNDVPGIVVTGGASTIRGLVINRFSGRGIRIVGGSGSSVCGNYVGIDVSGSVPLGDGLGGIGIDESSGNNTIGALTASDRNVSSANGRAGISVGGFGNSILGNYIGVDASGEKALPNAQDGVHIMYSVSDNAIGDESGTGGNLISGNTRDGVRVILGVANSILSNSIHSNGALGIDLQGNGVTPNDWRDLDNGANTLQNYPELLSASTSEWGSSIRGKLNSTPSAAFRIEFFSNTAADPSGYGEGETFIHAISETADGSGNAFFTVILPFQLPVGSYITSTATNALNNTSEFSEAIPVEEMTLAVQLEISDLLLEWSPVPEIAAYWVYGTQNDAFFEPGGAPGYDYRLAVVAPDLSSWLTDLGIGNPAENWTYLVMAMDASGQELCRTNRVGEFDFDW